MLEFFGVKPDSVVVEVWPGTGWWTEILGPYLRDHGIYYAAGFATTLPGIPEYQIGRAGQTGRQARRATRRSITSCSTQLGYPGRLVMAPPGHVDVLMTFRNVHNWLAGGYAKEMFAAFHRTLKSGGVLGVVEHRAKPGTSIDVMKKSGYMTEEYVIGLAKEAGFTLEGKSEVNANPKDDTDHPQGVWSLPPNLAVCKPMPEGAEKDACVTEYRAIGESDRMTLKFRKP